MGLRVAQDPGTLRAMTEQHILEARVDEVRDALVRLHAQATDLINAITDPQTAFDKAGDLGRTIADLAEANAGLRALQAGRIWDELETALAALAAPMNTTRLAARLGISRQMAARLMERARKEAER
jgi:hypothetical protein